MLMDMNTSPEARRFPGQAGPGPYEIPRIELLGTLANVLGKSHLPGKVNPPKDFAEPLNFEVDRV